MKQLSKEEMKKVRGGLYDGGGGGGGDEGLICKNGPCKVVVLESDGTTTTNNGNCSFDLFGTNSCYCDAMGAGIVPLVTSNGGHSRCWAF